MWCRNDRCDIDELHEAHEDDFARKPRLRTKAQLLAHYKKQQPPTTRVRQMRHGPMAYVQCPECVGGGCGFCYEQGEIALYRWHVWRRGC